MRQTLPILFFAGATLLATSASAAWRSDPIRLELPGGSLEVEIVPEGSRALSFDRIGPDRWVLDESTEDLVGRGYTIELRNRTSERLKVVVAVDGVNVYWKKPVVGTSREDTGSILYRHGRRHLEGFQVDRHTAQRFVFSPPDWSEGEGVTDGRIGTIQVQVYREWIPEVWSRKDSTGRSVPEARSQSRHRSDPPLGTTAGEDFENDVRSVRFVSRTEVPEARALLVYGRPGPPDRPHQGLRLGIQAEDTRGGFRITEVYSGSLADEAGLRIGDLVVEVDSARSPTVRELRRILERKRPGDYIFLDLERGPHHLVMKLRLDGRSRGISVRR